MKLAWASDTHFDHKVGGAEELGRKIKAFGADAFLITGDMATATTLPASWNELICRAEMPGYFVLGNHDYWGGSFESVRKWSYSTGAHLEDGKVRHLTPTTCLVGLDGWYDGLAGDVLGSRVIMNDWFEIEDFREVFKHGSKALAYVLQRLGEENAKKARGLLDLAAKNFKRIVLATHVPPFTESALYQNKPSNSDYAPFFVNVQLGDMLLEFAHENLNVRVTVLCGHMHHKAHVSLGNLQVFTASARYGAPGIAQVLDLDTL